MSEVRSIFGARGLEHGHRPPQQKKTGADMEMNEAMNLHTRRKIERRELWVYFAAAFLVVLPLVMMTRALDLFRGRVRRRRGSIIEETSSRVGTLLGFVFMA